MKKFLLPVVATVILLTGCVTAQTDGVMEAETRKGGFMGLATNADIKVATAAAFKERQKVVIGGFKVGFNESKKITRKAGGGLLGSASGGRSSGLAKLEGVSATTMQAITDKAYSDFVGTLKKQGYTVVSRSDLASSASFQKAKMYNFPYTDDNSGFLSSYGQATYYSPSAIGSKQPIYAGEIEGVIGGIGFSNANMASSKFGEETGAAVLNVAYFVDFAGDDSYGGKWTISSRVKVGQLLSVDQGYLGLTAGQGGTFSKNIGNMTLGQPIASDKEFATIEDSTTGVDKGVQTAMNVTSLLLGGGTNMKREYVYHANSSKYKAASLQAIQQANQAFVGKMVSLK